MYNIEFRLMMEIHVIKLVAILLFLIASSESALALTGTTTVNECYKTASVLCSNYTDNLANTGCEPQMVTGLRLFLNLGYYILSLSAMCFLN